LAIEVQQQNRAGEAFTLGELGNLYDRMGRLEEAVTFFRQAADIYAQLQDKRYEGAALNNLGNTSMNGRKKMIRCGPKRWSPDSGPSCAATAIQRSLLIRI
jgi:tetratricopeptide (TPR) repeat protein